MGVSLSLRFLKLIPGQKIGDFETAKWVSLSVADGSIFDQLGPNGAGKTPTISMHAWII
jgi:ABC-type multidrug transport system ATPase subunit